MKLPFWADHLRTERFPNFRQRGRLGFDDLPGEVVSIQHHRTAPGEQLRAGRFAHPDAAGKSDGFHCGGQLKKNRTTGKPWFDVTKDWFPALWYLANSAVETLTVAGDIWINELGNASDTLNVGRNGRPSCEVG